MVMVVVGVAHMFLTEYNRKSLICRIHTQRYTAIVAGCDANNLIERHLVWLSRCQIISLAVRRDGKCKWCGQVRCSLMENLCRPEPQLTSEEKQENCLSCSLKESDGGMLVWLEGEAEMVSSPHL